MALGADGGCVPVVLSWRHSKSTPCLLVRHKHRHTNHHAAASLAFKFAPAPLGVTHHSPAMPFAHTTHDARAGRDAQSRARRFSNLGSSSSCRRRWCVQVIQELAEMPRPAENEAGLTAPRPEVFLGDLNLGVWERAWWPFPVAMRPRGRWPARRVRAFSLFG